MTPAGLREALALVLGGLMLALGIAGLIWGFWDRAWVGIVLGGVIVVLAVLPDRTRPELEHKPPR